MQGIEFEEENSYIIKDVVVKQSFMKSFLSKVVALQRQVYTRALF
ncbi:MAG: hypothetical protein WBC83_03875 [Minisyncoccia bacterium]